MRVGRECEGVIRMGTYSKGGSAEQDLKWAYIWFKKFSSFHRCEGDNDRTFTKEEVIAFLQSKPDAGLPAWKRMKIIEGLML